MNRAKITLLLLVTMVASAGTAPAIREAVDAKFVGRWVFMYKGQKRPFQFNDNKTFEGSYPVSGKHFFGNWKVAESEVILIRGGETENWGVLTLKPDGEAAFSAEGYQMIGQKTEP